MGDRGLQRGGDREFVTLAVVVLVSEKFEVAAEWLELRAEGADVALLAGLAGLLREGRYGVRGCRVQKRHLNDDDQSDDKGRRMKGLQLANAVDLHLIGPWLTKCRIRDRREYLLNGLLPPEVACERRLWENQDPRRICEDGC